MCRQVCDISFVLFEAVRVIEGESFEKCERTLYEERGNDEFEQKPPLREHANAFDAL